MLLSWLVAAAALAAPSAHARYDAVESRRMEPLLIEAIRFPTVAGDARASEDEQAWLRRTAAALGLTAREAGPVTEIELPGPPGAPVLGLVVHGDVQPVDPRGWKAPPFAGIARGGEIVGRGAADDKGPLVQALLALSALRASGAPRTHTVRLLVGSDEESGSQDMGVYLAAHEAPAYSLVLDANFPVTVGEKAWNALAVTAPADGAAERRAGARPAFPFVVAGLEAGLAPSIVPDRAQLTLHWSQGGKPAWPALLTRLRDKRLGPGLSLETTVQPGGDLVLLVRGRAAHAGVNLDGGRNALVALARLVEGELPAGGADDLLAFARLAGQDLTGTGLGLTEVTPIWGRYAVNVATVVTKTPFAPGRDGQWSLVINLRRPPPLTGPQLRARLEQVVAGFNARTGAKLVPGGFYGDEPLAFDPQAKLVRRLTAAYRRATGRDDPPAISGGGTYAKRIPRAIAFGMWFPDKPYPGHDVDEHNPIADLHLGAHALIEALIDLAGSPALSEPFKP